MYETSIGLTEGEGTVATEGVELGSKPGVSGLSTALIVQRSIVLTPWPSGMNVSTQLWIICPSALSQEVNERLEKDAPQGTYV